MEIAAEVSKFLLSMLRESGDDKPLTPDGSLFLSQRLDSLSAMKLVVFLERQFGWRFTGGDWSLARLDTLEKICREVEDSRKKSS